MLEAAPLGDRPTIVVSQDTCDEEGIPAWAAPIFARQQARLAALGRNVIHVRADGVRHFMHRDEPAVMIDAIELVVQAVRDGDPLPPCREVDQGVVTCLT